MSSLDKAEIQKIAWLARLAIDEDDIAGYSQDLSNILKLVEQMNSIDTTTVDPMAHPLEMTARMRPDQVTESDRREKFQACAQAVENGLYLVPRVIE
ncbi:MAG: asparaginyl/glutamyl-tRNA amidotransferase subunit C [Gammaproteobacteria bacterium RIFCSPLOWO2_02_FULL_52_10]|nr:MAG: asparaginyl/glutamyl-tRNA amidotransferase subunit C [Gammaproteobacteria bacterium RIFCSPLOWO2_02_FULL_52_10]OGT82282.1 MAG: asparaginyl/glutamyl-tRNA amidotransferase subunit C [Gammaproteobacteria bacterium RIFCSPLOWO2_12_FULL_52_10]